MICEVGGRDLGGGYEVIFPIPERVFTDGDGVITGHEAG
jgi:hypothetical protein